MAKSGKSKSNSDKFGERREAGGNILAPRSLRKKGKKFLSECNDKELIKSGVKEE